MAGRPRKHVIDYFPHYTDASEGRTLTILQNRFGNDGYAVWFRLLERLGRSEGHCYDCTNPESWNFLVAKLHVSDISATEILDLLANLGAIDPQLWGQKVIWCQKFVDGLSQVYNKREAHLPSRPCISGAEIPISVAENTQSRVEESRVNKSRVEETVSAAAKAYEENIGQLTGIVRDELVLAINEYPEGWVIDALKETAKSNVHRWTYTTKILERWKVEGRHNGHKGNGNNGSDPSKVDTDKYKRSADAARAERERILALREGMPDLP